MEKEIKDMIVKNMSMRLRVSGYNQKQIRDIISSGLKGYNKKWGQGQTRQRRGQETEGARSLKKLVGKSSWFKMKFKETGEQGQENNQPRSHPKKAGRTRGYEPQPS